MATEKTFNLGYYTDKISDSYKSMRKEYESAAAELAAIDEKYNKSKIDVNLSPEGKQNAANRYHEDKTRVLNKFADIRDRFNYSAADIRNQVDNIFRDKYVPNSKDLDLNMVEMLKSGMISDRELLEYADRYKANGNLTMYRYLGTYADKNSDNEQLKILALNSNIPADRDDLALIDSMTEICNAGLRDDVVLSDGINSRYDEVTAEIRNAADSLTYKTTVPFNINTDLGN